MYPIPKRQKKLPPVIVAAPAPPPIPLIVVAHAPETTANEPDPDAPSAMVAAAHRAHPAGPTHLEGVVIEIVGITACNQVCSCEEHPYCREVIDDNVVIRLCCIQVIIPSKNGGPGQEVTAVAVYWVTDGIDRCPVGFLPAHMVKYATRYDGVLAQVTETFCLVVEGDKTVCEKYHRNKGFCRAVIILALNNN
jgi:hypothetical protein